MDILGAILTLFNLKGDLPKSGGERSKNPGRKVSGRECQRGVIFESSLKLLMRRWAFIDDFRCTIFKNH